MTTVDYSNYKYKIKELERQDWEGLKFTLHFTKEISDIERKDIETTIDAWFIHGQETSDGGFHFLSDFTWPDKQTLKWWIDFGDIEPDKALTSLFDLLSRWSELIGQLDVGEDISASAKQYFRKTTVFPGVDASHCPFKVTILEHNDTDWPFTLYLKRPFSYEIKKQMNKTINTWFQKVKNNPEAEDPWISDPEWRDDTMVTWWVGGRSGKPEIFNKLFDELSQFSVGIEELIIGARFPNREKIDYGISGDK